MVEVFRLETCVRLSCKVWLSCRVEIFVKMVLQRRNMDILKKWENGNWFWWSWDFFLAQYSSKQKQKTVRRSAHFLWYFPPVKGKHRRYSVPSLKSLWKEGRRAAIWHLLNCSNELQHSFSLSPEKIPATTRVNLRTVCFNFLLFLLINEVINAFILNQASSSLRSAISFKETAFESPWMVGN